MDKKCRQKTDGSPMQITPTARELAYRAKNFQDSKPLERKRIACATCGTNLSGKMDTPGTVFIHPLMITLQCKKCSDFYGDGEFSMDEDGDDKYCRMCGNGGELYLCGNKPCPYGFCHKCIKRYLGADKSEVEADDWKCLYCNCKPLWDVRAVCAVITVQLERKLRKHKEYATRHRDHNSDDNLSHSEDSDVNLKSEKPVTRRHRKFTRLQSKAKRQNDTFEKFKEISNNNRDSPSSSVLLDNNPIYNKRNSNRSSYTISDADDKAGSKKNSAGSYKKEKRLIKKYSSSEDEMSNNEEMQISRNLATQAGSKFPMKKNMNLRGPIKQNYKSINHAQKHSTTPESSTNSASVRNDADSNSNSDSESDHESANDFVSKKKKIVKTQKENFDKGNLTVNKERSNNSDNSNSKANLKRLSKKFEAVMVRKKICKSSCEAIRTEPTNGNNSLKDSNINTNGNKRQRDELNKEVDRLDEHPRSKTEGSALGKAKVVKEFSNSDVKDKESEEIPKSSAKLLTLSNFDRASGQMSQTKSLSTKLPPAQTFQASSARYYHDGFLDRRKAAIKLSYAKFTSNKEHVTKDQGNVIKGHVSSLIADIKMLGEGLSTGANEITERHWPNDVTSVPAVSKTVLKYALLMIRCKKHLDNIESHFIESYENWCQSTEVKSIFSDVEDVHIAACNETELTIDKETCIDIKEKERISQDSKAQRTTDHSAQNSDASNDNNNTKTHNQRTNKVSASASHSEDTHSNIHIKPVDSRLSNTVQKDDTIIRDSTNGDSDRDSKNSAWDKISECDSDAIFSGDENRAMAKKANESVKEKICTQSPVSNTSEKRSVQPNSDACDNIVTENLNSIREKSSQTDNVSENLSSGSENRKRNSQEKRNAYVMEDSSDKSLRLETSIDTTHRSDSSMENLYDETVDTPLSPNKESNSNTSEKRSVQPNSDACDNIVTENLNSIREKSSQTDNISENLSSGSENRKRNSQEKRNASVMEDNGDKSLRLETSIDTTHRSDSSMENLYDETVDTPLSPNEESEDPSDTDQPVTNHSKGTDKAPVTKKSHISKAKGTSKVKENSLDDVQLGKADVTSGNSSQTSQCEDKQEALVHDTSRNTNRNMDDLSDSDTAHVFTQLSCENLTNEPKINPITKSPDPEQNAAESEGSEHMSSLEIESDTEIPLQNDVNDKDDSVVPTKEPPRTPETIAKPCEGAADSDTNKSLDDNFGCLKFHKKFQKREEIVEAAALLSDDVENNSEESAGAVDEDGTAEIEKNQTTAIDYDSEDAIKKKILESDSELSDADTEIITKPNNFELKMTSDSEGNSDGSVSADPTTDLIISDGSKINNKPQSFEKTNEKCKTDSIRSRSEDVDISILNNLAKNQLLSSSDSNSSDSVGISPVLPSNLNSNDSSSSSFGENDEIGPISTDDKGPTILISSKGKRRKFNVENNYYYKNDKKLQMTCEVVVRKLDKNVLAQFTRLLDRCRQRQDLNNFKSLVDLSNIKKRKRGTVDSNQSESSSESTSSKSSKGCTKKTKSKEVQEKEETLLEHLEKMKNGENYCDLSDDGLDGNNEIPKKLIPDLNAEEEILTKANKLAKDLLIQSSDSENEEQTSIGNDEEQKEDEESKSEAKKGGKKGPSVPNEEAVDSESNHENGSNAEKDNEETSNAEKNNDSKESEGSDSDRTRERKKMKEGLAKRNWRLTDSDTSSDERKWQKSQLAKGDEKKNAEEKEHGSKSKKKIKRRVLGSDSDSIKLTDLSDDAVQINEEDNKSSSGTEDSTEIFQNLRKKRRKKRNTEQKSETDSESEQEEKPSRQKRKRIKKMDLDSDSDENMLNNSQDTPGKLHRKNIRKVLKDKQVADVTKIAGKEEEERLKRIAERQKLYNEMYELKLASEAKVDKLILDFDEETKKELVSVHEDLVKRLKPHQAQGIKFMWDACFESLERTKSTMGSGCIVAHCMGLGKTFQVVTLAHTLLTHPETGIKTIMVICPLSTVLNWVNEFKKWLGEINNDKDVKVFEMTKMKKDFERKFQLEKWYRLGGVMVLGYEMFRLLSNKQGKKMRKSAHEAILKCLVDPGPDLIVCDEGHLLKNEDTALSKAMRRVKTLRRIVLTGTPLQNNLVEYHCMVQFVKPNLLGTKKEFLNRFVNPITNGQFDDSTEYDVKLMKKRAHVLHKMLEGSVQRFDYSVLTPFLPPKQEYVITVRLADIQIKLYQYYLDNFSRNHVGAGTSLFADFQALQRIWTHPIVLRMNAEKMEKINEKKRMDASDSEGSLKDFLDDDTEENSTSDNDSDVVSIHGSSDEKFEKPKRVTRANPIDIDAEKQEEEELPQTGEWWSQFIEPEHFEDMRISSKLVLLFAILKESEQIGDKVLVFSQSLYALSLIEEFLNKIDDETQNGTTSELIEGHSGRWSQGLDYFRLDGQTPPENRSRYCKIFNNPKNSRARLFLISTRAGGLGINLTAANRVVIFDASWNPSHDVQSIFRIYRFGQKKPCYVYRFLAQGTMEEKIYNRQVTKLSLSCRVVDEQQIERHYSNHDLAELYQFEPNTSKDKPTLNLPKDRLLAEILRKYEDRIETFHEHDSLLENKAEEELDEEERKEAWKEYEDERTGRKMYMNNMQNQNLAMQQYNEILNRNQDIANRATLSGINIENLQALIRKDYPNSTPEQQTMMTSRAIMDMYTYMENEAVRQQQMAAAASSFTYPTVSNIGSTSYVDKNPMTQAQRQYALQQQQQLQQIMMQRDTQANYAKRYGNVRGLAHPATATRPPQIVNLQIDDNEVIEVPETSPTTAEPTPSSSVQAPSAPAPAENSKRQEE